MIEIYIKENTLVLNGKITLNNIVQTLATFEEKAEKLTYLDIDMKNLSNSDSAALLFILNCIKYSIKNKKKIFFLNVSNVIFELSKVYNLNNIINKKVKKNETDYTK